MKSGLNACQLRLSCFYTRRIECLRRYSCLNDEVDRRHLSCLTLNASVLFTVVYVVKRKTRLSC